MAKALLLLSGGLDSTLAGKLLLELGIEVDAINFVSPFCCCTPKTLGCSAAKAAAEQLGIEVRVLATGAEYLETIKHPRFGRGSGMNPCLDCRIHMFTRTRELLAEYGADFVATGEVVGERPMSQRREAMALIERESGLSGLIVRPLCAKLLPPSLPEQQGLVDRERMLSIQGRGRRPQMQLADDLGIKDWLCPAGGCLLTDPEFAVKFRDLLEHDPDFDAADARLLRHGRHFRLPGGAKVIVGRDDQDNAAIERAARPGDALLTPVDVPGPSVLCREPFCDDDVQTAAALLAAYSKNGQAMDVRVNGDRTIEGVTAANRDDAAPWRVASAGAR